MASKKTSGRGTKQERKAARRAAAGEGRGPAYPSRNDRALPGAVKQRMGPRRSSGRGR